MTANTPGRAFRSVNPILVTALALLMHDDLQSAKFLIFKILIMAIIAVQCFAARLGYYLLISIGSSFDLWWHAPHLTPYPRWVSWSKTAGLTPSIVICSCGFSVATVIPENRMHRVVVPINSLVTFIFHPLVLKKYPA